MCSINILNNLVNDLALDGNEGWTLNQLFSKFEALYRNELVNNVELDIMPNFDDGYREVIWNTFKNYSQIIYIENNQAIDPQNFTYQEIKVRSETIKVKATEEIQDINIYGRIRAIKAQLTNRQKLILHTIAKYRAAGVTQYDLSKELNMDTKVIHYNIKRLDQLNLIFKQKAYASKMSTRLLVLQRFKAENEQIHLNNENTNTNVIFCLPNFEETVKLKLTETKDKMMTLSDLIKSLGITDKRKAKWAKCQIMEMHKRRVLERIVASDGKRQSHCVRLLEKEEEDASPRKLKETSSKSNDAKLNYNIYRDLPSYHTLYKDVLAASDKGFTTQDMAEKYPSIDPVFFQLFFKKATIPSEDSNLPHCLYRIEEREKRVRRYRYFSLEGWKTFNEKRGTPLSDTEIAPTPDTQEAISNRLENEIDSCLEEPASIDDIFRTLKRRYKTLNRKMNLVRTHSRRNTILNNSQKVIERSDNSRLTANNEKAMESSASPTENTTISKSNKREQPMLEANDNQNISSPCSSIRSSKRLKQMVTNIQNNELLGVPDTHFKVDTSNNISMINEEQQQSEASTGIPVSNSLKRRVEQIEITDEATFIPSNEAAPSPDNLHKKVKQTTKSKKTAPFNTTRALRYDILLNILEEDHIRELNSSLALEFNNIESERENLANKISRQTLKKIATELHEQKKLTVYVCSVKQPNGITVTKTLLLHHSLTSESEEVKRYIDDYSLDKYMMSTIAKTEKLKLVSVDKIPEVEGQSGTGSKSKEMGNQDYSEYGKWRLIARENGWIASKWLRAREIHESLFEYYDTHGRNQAIDLNVFWRTVRLRTIMKIYGLLPYNDPIFADFLKTESNRNISLNELPLMVKNVVSKQLPKIRYSARESIAVLKALELISIKDEDRIGIQAKLILCDTGVVKNYTLKERPEKLRMQLKRKEDRQEFWEVLQAYCTKLYAEHNTIDDKNDPLFNITLRRTWSVSVELTKNQKLILDSFVDMDAQTVPNEDDISLYNYIMKKTNLSANRIKLYYYSVLVSFDKYNKKKDRIARKKYLRQSALSSPTIEKLMKASKKKNKVESLNDKPIDNNPFMVPTFVGSRPFQKVRNYPQVARPDKYIKDIFSETEKNLLLHAYVIMRSRSKFSIFRWQPITKVITKHTAERCRRVISSMQVKDPNFDEKINKLTTKWTKYYKEGISKKELKDEKPWDCKNYDLPVFLEYFIGRLMKEDSSLQITRNLMEQEPMPEIESHIDENVPNEVEDDNHLTEVEKTEKGKAKRKQELEIARREKLKRIEELQIRKNKIREKQLMQKYPFALSVGSNEKNSDMPVISSSIDINKAHLEMVVVIIKMIIMTDQNNYSPEDAFLTLREYSNEIIDQALEILKEKNIIIFDKTRYGRIPGRHINVSNKFLELISGTLPHDHFENGKEYYNKILTNDKLNIEPSDLDSGSMLTLLQLAFEEKIEINLKDADKYLENKIHTPMPKRREAQARKEYLFSYFDLIITRKATLPAMNAKKLKDKATNNRFMLPTSQQIVEYFKPNTPANPSKQIYEIICTFEDKGATFAEIMEKAIMSDTSYTENRVIEVLEKLLNSSPPIIQIAGLNSLRYITSEFAGKWLLYNKQSSTYIPPLMWNETNGNVIETALEGFGNTVISHILDNPGISFASLSSKLKEVSTKYELYHTLSYLLKTEKIISRKIVSSGKRTLFSKQSIEMVDVSNMAMISNGLTCYWLAPKYYFV